MKIVSVCRVYPTQRPGGMPFVCQDRAEELVRQGHDVHVLVTSVPEEHQHEVVNGVNVHYADGPPQAYSTRFAEYCAAFCRSYLPDVIHLDSFDRDRVWWISRPGNPKVVAITMHGNAVGTALTEWNLMRSESVNSSAWSNKWAEERKGLLQADRVIAISKNEEWQLRDVLAVPHTRLVYNPIPSYFFNPEPVAIPDGAPLLCAAISGHQKRGFDIARQVVAKLGRTLRIAQNIPRHEMPALYRSCAAVILPTYYAQGYDLTCAEAIASGRMVYASPTGSYLRERDPRSVVIAEENSVEAFIKLITIVPPVVLAPSEVRYNHRPHVHVQRWLGELGL